MTTILAAIDNSAAATPVLATALALRPVLDAHVEAVHVADSVGDSARTAAQFLDVPLRWATGDPLEQITRMAGEDDVVTVVFGARSGPTGPAGHLAQSLANVIAKPVILVPPGAEPPARIRRVLVAMEGTRRNARDLQRAIELGATAEVELIAVHVDDETSIPMFCDQVQYETEAYANEFLARYCHGAPVARLELRVGAPVEQILAVADEVAADMVALGWPQDPNRGQVAREIVNRTRRPVLLVALANSRPSTG